MYRDIFAPVCHLLQNVLSKTKLSQSIPLHAHMLHTESYTSTYKKKSASVWVNLKIDSIKLDHFPPWLNHKQVYSKINYKLLWPCTHWTCYLTIKGIYYLYYFLMILNTLLNIFLYDQTFQKIIFLSAW